MPPSLSLFLIGMLTGAKQDKPQWASVLFQPVLKAYPTQDSCMNSLNKQLHIFNCQKAQTHELPMKLQYQPFASNFILNALLGKITNIDSIYHSHKPTLQMAILLLWTEPALDKLSTANSPWPKRNLLPLLGGTLQYYYKGYNRNQAPNKSINARTGKTTRTFSTHHLHPKCHMIQHPSKEAEAKWGNGCLPEGEWRCKYTIQYHRNSNTASQIPTNIHLCLHYVGLPQGLPHIHETSCHMHNGLCQHSDDKYTVTRYEPSRRTQKYAQTHQIATTFNNASTHIIRWCPPFLPVSKDTHAGSRWTIFTAHRCTYTEQSTHNSSKYMKSSTYQFHMVMYQLNTNQKQIYRSYIWQNTSSHEYRAAVLNMPSCKWAILQNRCTISSSHKPPIRHNGPICQEWPRKRSTVFPICISYTTYIPTHCKHVKPMDLHLKKHYTSINHNIVLAW